MTITLTGTAHALVVATNAHDVDALTGLFTADATVTDNGEDFAGPDAIAAWIAEHQIAPEIVLTPIAYDDATRTLTANATGQFPGGGPLPFTFQFTNVDDKIQHLVISLAE